MDSSNDERILARLNAILDSCDNEDSIERELRNLHDDPDIDTMCFQYCNQLIYAYCAGYVKYPQKENAFMQDRRQRIISNIENLPFKATDFPYLLAVSCFFRGDKTGCIRSLGRFLECEYTKSGREAVPIDEVNWADIFLDTFKNAYPGFWTEIAKMLSSYPHEKEVIDLCHLMESYYQCDTDESAIDVLLTFYGEHPNPLLPKELLGFTYSNLKMWNNALSFFEQVEQNSVLFYEWNIAFQMAWCYGQLKDYKAEETYYRKCLESNPSTVFAENNLGYCLYKQKRYPEAIEVLQHCLDDGWDLPFAANNYVRVLLATGQYKTAAEFVDSQKFKVSPDIVKRVKKHKPVNLTRKNAAVEDLDEANHSDAEQAPPDFGIKRHQFSSEKALEDELVARIESGQNVFGIHLKVFRRRGEYGRQLPIANGKWRLDLLCEDDDGNLYVIELKKDSGYDDPYEQTKNYVEWMTKHRCPKGKKVFGIICLNTPTKAVIEKVRVDARIKLFEYQISYCEIK